MYASTPDVSMDSLGYLQVCRDLSGTRARQVRVGSALWTVFCREFNAGSVGGDRGVRVGCGAASERHLYHNRRSSEISDVVLRLAGAQRANAQPHQISRTVHLPMQDPVVSEQELDADMHHACAHVCDTSHTRWRGILAGAVYLWLRILHRRDSFLRNWSATPRYESQRVYSGP